MPVLTPVAAPATAVLLTTTVALFELEVPEPETRTTFINWFWPKLNLSAPATKAEKVIVFSWPADKFPKLNPENTFPEAEAPSILRESLFF